MPRRREEIAIRVVWVAFLVAEFTALWSRVEAFPVNPSLQCSGTVLSKVSGYSTRCYANGRGTMTGLPNPGNNKRREKKNKYASHSKADKCSMDPLEELIAASESKVRQLEIEKTRRRNGALPRDEKDSTEKGTRNPILFPDTKSIDPYDPSTYGYTELGTIIGAHGVHGLLKITAVTEFAERLCQSGVRHLKAPSRRSPRQVNLLDGRHRLEDEYLITLEGIGDRDAANKLRGSVLYARQEERPEDVGEDEYLVQDLVGLDVFLEEGYGEDTDENSLGGSHVGTVGGVVLAEDMCSIPGLGQDMLEVVLPRGFGGICSWRDELVLIPLVPQIVPRIDVEGKSIHITPPDGLLDLKYVREEKTRIKGFLPPAAI